MKNTQQKIKVAIYARVSTDKQDTERQIRELKDFASLNNWEVAEEVTETISGKKTSREGIVSLLSLARSRKINKVLIHEVSRLGRNLADAVNTVEQLKQCKVSVFDYNQKQDTLDKEGNFTIFGNIILPLLAGLAAQEAQTLSLRTKSGIENARAKGKIIGRPRVEKIKFEDKVVAYFQKGIIETEIGRIIKASNRNIAKYLDISVDTVKRVKRKYFLNEKIA